MEFKSIPKPVPHPGHPQYLNRIRFRHPGYDDPTNVLLVLPRVDQNAHGSFGIHHATAHTACAIVAANAFQGFLALDAAGAQRVDDPLNEILTAEDYFFIVEDCTAGPYPVVASFRDWAFPHGQLPSAWAQAAAGLTTPQQGICALTQFSLPLESAHLVPQHELDWFLGNGLDQYINSAYRSIHATANLLQLRRDFHAIFDQRRFVIVPKIPPPSDSGSASTTPVFVCHLLEVMDYYYAHNGLVHGVHVYSAPFLFARFAWAILLRAKAFVVSGQPRHVRVAIINDNGQRVYENKFMAAKDLWSAYSGAGQDVDDPYGDDFVDPYCESGDFDSSGDEFCDDRRPKRPRRGQDSSEATAPNDNKPKLAETVDTELRQAAAVIVNRAEGGHESETLSE